MGLKEFVVRFRVFYSGGNRLHPMTDLILYSAVFVTAAFSFAGTELVGLAASETSNPRESMPAAVKGTFWRITIIYIASLTVIGLLIPFTEPRLLGGSGAGEFSFSPRHRHPCRFSCSLDHLPNLVADIWNTPLQPLHHLSSPCSTLVSMGWTTSSMVRPLFVRFLPFFSKLIPRSQPTATICISVLSIGLSCVFAGSRTLTALAETGYAPKCFTYIDRAGRPLYSVLAILAFAPIAYINVRAPCPWFFYLLAGLTSPYLTCTAQVADVGSTVFDWLLALSGLSTLFTWGAICLTQ